MGKLWLFWGKEQLQFGCNLIGSTRSSRVPPGTLTSSPTIYSTVMKHRNRCVLSASCVPQEGRRAEQVLNRQKTPLLPYKHMCLHNGEKKPSLTKLTEFVRFRFQQSGFKRFCSSAKALASSVYIRLSSFFIFFHLSPSITLMALQHTFQTMVKNGIL